MSQNKGIVLTTVRHVHGDVRHVADVHFCFFDLHCSCRQITNNVKRYIVGLPQFPDPSPFLQKSRGLRKHIAIMKIGLEETIKIPLPRLAQMASLQYIVPFFAKQDRKSTKLLGHITVLFLFSLKFSSMPHFNRWLSRPRFARDNFKSRKIGCC
ncbi:hypothetical protein BCR42DRAFT_390599 [Absidia repens]|uniref:Uncharacterized protein n=1 Tax=Absidia repens TaxID=90262 RepID=A0A1X2IL20_9FUNG|nr:hypothetical protein BCR42DRAFT_390599 [Absidia repens]